VPAYDSLSRLSSVEYPSGTGNAGNGTSLDHITYDPDTGRPTEIQWNDASDALMTSNARSYNIAGDVIDESFDGVDPYTAGANYSYDSMGRLTAAHVPGHTLAYGFGNSSDCEAQVDTNAYYAGQNTNRTSITDNGTTTQWCYDHADRLVASITGSTLNDDVAYDDHGNTTTFGTNTLVYDSSDRHIATTNGTDTVTYTRDTTGGIIERQVTGQNPEPLVRYGAGAAGSSLTMDNQNNIIETTISLPGGASVTIGSSSETWSYPNLSGSTAATANAAGAKQGATRTYDPDGKALAGIPDNHAGSFDGGWMGAVGTDHPTGIMEFVEMGARVYSPIVGRFLQIDPVRGGSANNYDYANADPINQKDLTGTEPIYIYRSYARLHRDHAAYLNAMKHGQIGGWRPSYEGSLWRSQLYGFTHAAQIMRSALAYANWYSWRQAAAYAVDRMFQDIWTAILAAVYGRMKIDIAVASAVSKQRDVQPGVMDYVSGALSHLPSLDCVSSVLSIIADGMQMGEGAWFAYAGVAGTPETFGLSMGVAAGGAAEAYLGWVAYQSDYDTYMSECHGVS